VDGTDAIEIVDRIMSKIPAPQITLQPVINVEIPKPGAMKNTPVRDENGVILHTIQEPVDGD